MKQQALPEAKGTVRLRHLDYRHYICIGITLLSLGSELEEFKNTTLKEFEEN